MAETDDQPSYIDYETFLAPSFDASAFANTLVLATNDPQDAPLDLATPLSRVLFDIQEIDSHIDLLTARSAVPLLTHTKNQTHTSTRIVADLEPQMLALNDSYRQLEKQVLAKHGEAEEVRQVAARLWETLRLGRAVGRCLQLGRQLEVQYAELGASPSTASTTPSTASSAALVRCAHTILGLREVLQQKGAGEEGQGVDKVDAIRTLQHDVVAPAEKGVREAADRAVREFSLGASAGSLTFSQTEEARARTVSALTTLYLISPTNLTKNAGSAVRHEPWTPIAMLQALEAYLRAALQSSLTALARSLASLPTLERTLAEVSARCQNIVALEAILAATKAPQHPLRSLLNMPAEGSLLQPLLAKLETGSLPSYFWRTLASHLSPRVQDIMTRGGIAARTLRSSKASVGDTLRECVIQGMQTSTGTTERNSTASGGKTWDREIAVMMGSVTAHLGR